MRGGGRPARTPENHDGQRDGYNSHGINEEDPSSVPLNVICPIKPVARDGDQNRDQDKERATVKYGVAGAITRPERLNEKGRNREENEVVNNGCAREAARFYCVARIHRE